MNYRTQLQPLEEENQRLRANVHPVDWKNPRPHGRYNLVVVGGGAAGLVTAAGAAGLGAKVALVERGLLGGDCLNVGCVPSKGLISAARRLAAIRGASAFGVRVASPTVDFPEVMRRMRRLRASISPHDSAERFSGLGVDVFFGHGAFTSSTELEVGGQTLRFKKAVIASGGHAHELSIPGLRKAGYDTNETLFSITELPRRMLVIGGGPIGCEMAQAFARFGSEVTLVETSARILSRDDPDAANIVQTALKRDGVRLMLKATVERVELNGDERAVIVSQQGGGAGNQSRILCDRILVSAGRKPNVKDMGLETVGVRYDSQHGIAVDDRLRTTNRNIFAAGDVCSMHQFTHAADFMARTVIQNALFLGRAKASKLIIPWCTYTSPEVAHVGLVPPQAERHGIPLTSYTQPFADVDRAVLDGEEDGFVRVHCRRGTDRILGATIVAQHAGEMIGEIVLAMQQRVGLGKMAAVIHPYPTQAEAIRKLGDQYRRSRLTPRVKRVFHTWLRWTR